MHGINKYTYLYVFKCGSVRTTWIPNIGFKARVPEHTRVEVWARSGVSKFVPRAADGWTRRDRRGPGGFNQRVCDNSWVKKGTWHRHPWFVINHTHKNGRGGELNLGDRGAFSANSIPKLEQSFASPGINDASPNGSYPFPTASDQAALGF